MIAMENLQFSIANTKLKQLYNVPELFPWTRPKNRIRQKVYSLDLLSGWSCPFARDCLSKVHETGRLTKSGNLQTIIKDGPDTEFRCFSASQEVLLPGVYKRRKHNYDLLKQYRDNPGKLVELISQSMPHGLGILRYHVGGDIFSPGYLDAIIRIAALYPDKLFYAYTKSLGYWIKRRKDIDKLDNLILTASRGGRLDNLIDSEGLRESIVVFSEREAKDLGLAIDHDDSHAARPDIAGQSFALLIHGVQPKGSSAGQAVAALKGKGSYGKRLQTA